MSPHQPPVPRPPEARPRSAASLALWLAAAGALLLAAGTWFGSRALLRVGPVALVALVIAAVGAGCIIGAALLSALVPPHVEDDARAIARTLDAMARGDLGREPEPVHVDGPVEPVGSALGRVLGALRSTLGTARGAARETAQRADELSGQVSAAHLAAQRVAEQGTHVADQSGVAADRAREVHATLAQLGSGLAALEGAARAATEHGQRTAQASTRAASDLREAASGLEDLTGRFTTATTELAGLGRSVEEVQEFVALVRKMARQSKLLSLNAAMEAARAGESGSGFGVVAAEVRRLARGSAEAADRTETLLRELLSRASVAHEASRETLALARAAHDAVERSRAAMAGLRPEGPGPAAREAPESPAATLTAIAAQQEQLVGDLATLAQAARDARLAGGAQVARVQDLIAASHSLGRSAARAAAALQELRLEPGPEAAPAPAGPVRPPVARPATA